MRSLLTLGLILGIVAGASRCADAQISELGDQGGFGPPPTVQPLPKDESLPYEPGQPIPPGYHVVERTHVAPIVVGSILFGVSYGTVVFAALLIGTLQSAFDTPDDGSQLLLLPVMGPFAYMASSGNFEGVLVLDGIAQAAGVGLIAYGAFVRSSQLVPDHAGIHAAVPMAMPGGGGLVLSGTF